MMHVADTMSTSGDTMGTSGGYHEYIGGFSVHRGFQKKLKGFTNLLPHMHHDSPHCCIRTCKYLILTKNKNVQLDNYGKFGKKLLL